MKLMKVISISISIHMKPCIKKKKEKKKKIP